MAVTTMDKYREIRREVALRRNTYPRLIKAKKMTVADARRRIEIMEAIEADYLQRLGAEAPPDNE